MAAIFMWRVNEVEVLTTTLYPLDVNDGLEISTSFSFGSMPEIPSDAAETTYSLLNGTYTQLRWFFTDGPYEDSAENLYSLLDGTYTQLRWFHVDGPYDDSAENLYSLLDGTHIRKRVEADSPDEKLDISATIRNTCTMELV